MKHRDEYVKMFAPGTLLTLSSHPELGFWMVYHANVVMFPGNWYQLTADLLDPRQRLTRLEGDVIHLLTRWRIVT